jgi:hypothetical protein
MHKYMGGGIEIVQNWKPYAGLQVSQSPDRPFRRPVFVLIQLKSTSSKLPVRFIRRAGNFFSIPPCPAHISKSVKA